jgi:hypothetical protein
MTGEDGGSRVLATMWLPSWQRAAAKIGATPKLQQILSQFNTNSIRLGNFEDLSWQHELRGSGDGVQVLRNTPRYFYSLMSPRPKGSLYGQLS